MYCVWQVVKTPTVISNNPDYRYKPHTYTPSLVRYIHFRSFDQNVTLIQKLSPKIPAFSGRAITFVWTTDVSSDQYKSRSSILRSCLPSTSLRVSQAPVLICQKTSLSTYSVKYDFYCKVTGPRDVHYPFAGVRWDIRNFSCALPYLLSIWHQRTLVTLLFILRMCVLSIHAPLVARF